MYQIKNLHDNPNLKLKDSMGPFSVFEYQKDFSSTYETAELAYFANEMNIRKRQVLCDLSKAPTGVVVQAGAMQWMLGDVSANTGIKGVGDFFSKVARGKVTGESAIKPEYVGSGLLMLEPSYSYKLLLDSSNWGGSFTINDGLFLAAESSLQLKAQMIKSFSGAAAGGEGLFNLALTGAGVAVLESPVPAEELLEVDLDNDEIKIDGNFAIAWSSNLNFTVERSGKSLIGSAAGGEGLVNVYRGTGKVLFAPVTHGLS